MKKYYDVILGDGGGEPKPVTVEELKQDFKELNHYFDDLYHHGVNQVKDAGNLWIQFTDKFNAFKKRVLSLASVAQQPVHDLESQRSDAVEFGEWLRLNAFQHGDSWKVIGAKGAYEYLTTSQLYNLFKQKIQ